MLILGQAPQVAWSSAVSFWRGSYLSETPEKCLVITRSTKQLLHWGMQGINPLLWVETHDCGN